MEAQKPSLCRIVLFKEHSAAEPFPAVITKVWNDECVNLQVFGGMVSNPLPTSVQLEGVAPGGAPCWFWPKRA